MLIANDTTQIVSIFNTKRAKKMKFKSEISRSFITKFPLMSRGFKSVFQTLQLHAKKYIHDLRSQKEIAEHSGVSEKTVRRALNCFFKENWVGWKVRPYNTNIYVLNEDLIKISIFKIDPSVESFFEGGS